MEPVTTRRQARDDDGAIHVLEAVVIATIMVSAIAFVATFETPPQGSTSTRAYLGQHASDALNILYDTPVKGSPYGDNLLSVYLAQCMQGNCGNMTSKLDKLLPEGSSYALYISNGYETWPVHATRAPPGEAVSARRLLEPHWSYTFTSTGMQNVNNFSDSLVTYALPVFNGNVVAPGGSALKVVVEGKKLSDNSNYTLEALYTTLAVDSTNAPQYSAASLSFLVNRTAYEVKNNLPNITPRVPGSFWHRAEETINAAGHPTNASIPFLLRVENTGLAAIPAGTELTVSMPRSWNGSSWNTTQWDIVRNATDANATYGESAVVARLKDKLNAGASLEFEFNATYRGDLLNYYEVKAVLSKGADAEANLVVFADNWPDDTQTYAVPNVRMSVPRPMGSTATTTWTLAVNVPYSPASTWFVSKRGLGSWGLVEPPRNPTVSASTRAEVNVNTDIEILKITVTEEDGAPIFNGITPGRLTQGQWSSSATQLTWTGRHSTNDGPLNLTFSVTGSGTPGKQSPKQTMTPPVTFDKVRGRLLTQISPGLYRSAILPNNTTGQEYSIRWLGYDGPAQLASPLERDFVVDPVYKATLLNGEGNYTANPIAPFTDALFGSYVNVERRSVPIGGQVVLTADVQSILYALSQAGQSAGVNLTFYPPWSGNSKQPIWWQENLDSGVVTSSVTHIAMLDMNNDGNADPVVGTNQGRVFALDALTGERIQGNVWVAPILGTSTTVPTIRAMSTVKLYGVDHIAVATDPQSDVFILDKTLNDVWSYTKEVDVVGMDTSVDFDADGTNELVVLFDNSTVSVLKATPGVREMRALDPTTASGVPGAYYSAQGSVSGVWGFDETGTSASPGFGVAILNRPGSNVGVRVGMDNSMQPALQPPQVYIKTPRAGLDGVSKADGLAWQFLAGPTTVARPFDYKDDAIDDVVAGTTSGYVVMLNGKKGASPMSGGALVPAQRVLDADAHDASHAAIVTDDGGVYFTMDRWNVIWCVVCDPTNQVSHVDTRLRGLALNNTFTLWGVGEQGAAWRSVTDPVTHKPMMEPATLTTSKLGIPFLVGMVVNYNDVHFTWGDGASDGAAGNVGWIVAAPPTGTCSLPPGFTNLCSESVVLRTTNGGFTWTALTVANGGLTGVNNTMVTEDLFRINFTTPSVGWVVGAKGTLLRTTDSGATFQGVGVWTTANLTAISCVPTNPDRCYLAGEGGYLWRTFDATTGATWLNVTSLMPQLCAGLVCKTVNDIAVVDDATAYMGTSNTLLGTWNGGAEWSGIPLSYVPIEFTRITTFPGGGGYVFGGSEGYGFLGELTGYLGSAKAETVDLLGGALPVGAKVTWINATLVASSPAAGGITVFASADGATWDAAESFEGPTLSESRNSVALDVGTTLWSSFFANEAMRGDKAHVRILFNTPPDYPAMTSIVSHINATITYRLSGAAEDFPTPIQVSIDLKSDPKLAPGATSATWNAEFGQIHQPTFAKRWSHNVSGAVNDIQVGYDIGGSDTRHEVWVATGDVIAENNPDYQVWAAANPDAVVGSDRRIYVLDGATGGTLAKSAAFAGDVTHIRLADENDDGYPDYIYATTWDADAAPLGNGRILAFNATTLAPLTGVPAPSAWNVNLAGNEPAAIATAEHDGKSTVVVGTLSTTSSDGKPVSGGIHNVRGVDEKNVWSAIADERGHYLVTKDIPRDWFFGPYVVEVRVEWTDNVDVDEGGLPVGREVVQSARFYDYFLVTPPAALSPPSAIYDVHLIAWFDDWR